MKAKATTSPRDDFSEAVPKSRQGNPNIDEGVQEHHFGLQFAFDVNRQIGKLESGLASVERRLDRLEVKVDQIQIDLAFLKTTTSHLESLMKTSVKALWAITGSIGIFLLGILSVWLKHKFGW